MKRTKAEKAKTRREKLLEKRLGDFNMYSLAEYAHDIVPFSGSVKKICDRKGKLKSAEIYIKLRKNATIDDMGLVTKAVESRMDKTLILDILGREKRKK